MNDVLTAIGNSLLPACLMANAVGVATGIVFGALPGLTAVMGLALLLPLTFNMPVLEAFAALLGMYCGAIYGGSITAILIGTPGTVAAAATMLEGPALTARGQSKKALDMATIASFIGGIFSCVALIFIAPLLAKVATAFGPSEYFAVAFLGLVVVATLSSSNMLKGSIAGLIGLFMSTIGSDPITGELRNTFAIPDLYGGLPLVPVLVGLFAVGQIFYTMEGFFTNTIGQISITVSKEGLTLSELAQNAGNFLRSSIIGVGVGIIPATGSGTAAYIAYAAAKQASKTPELYGTGLLEGVAATESSNNAVTGGALVPLLTLGVPGDMACAIILGALMIQGVVPGPALFTGQAVVAYGIFSTLIISNVFMLIMGLLAVRPLAKLLLIPTNILMPCVLCMCIVGAFAINSSIFDLQIVFIFGILGYLMQKINMPTSPMLLAMILSPIAEINFRRALIASGNDYTVFVASPIALSIFFITICVALRTLYHEFKMRKSALERADAL